MAKPNLTIPRSRRPVHAYGELVMTQPPQNAPVPHDRPGASHAGMPPAALVARSHLHAEDFPTDLHHDGRIAWVLGLIGLSGAGAVAGLVMWTVGSRQRHRNPVAAHVGRRAARIGMVMALVPAVATVMWAVAVPALSNTAVWSDVVMIGPLGAAAVFLLNILGPSPASSSGSSAWPCP